MPATRQALRYPARATSARRRASAGVVTCRMRQTTGARIVAQTAPWSLRACAQPAAAHQRDQKRGDGTAPKRSTCRHQPSSQSGRPITAAADPVSQPCGDRGRDRRAARAAGMTAPAELRAHGAAAGAFRVSDLKVAIAGAGGKMGAAQHPRRGRNPRDSSSFPPWTAPGTPAIGKDASELAGDSRHWAFRRNRRRQGGRPRGRRGNPRLHRAGQLAWRWPRARQTRGPVHIIGTTADRPRTDDARCPGGSQAPDRQGGNFSARRERAAGPQSSRRPRGAEA